MITDINALRMKLLDVTRQCNTWKIKKHTERNPHLRDCLTTIIAMMEDYKTELKLQIAKLEKPS